MLRYDVNPALAAAAQSISILHKQNRVDTPIRMPTPERPDPTPIVDKVSGRIDRMQCCVAFC